MAGPDPWLEVDGQWNVLQDGEGLAGDLFAEEEYRRCLATLVECLVLGDPCRFADSHLGHSVVGQRLDFVLQGVHRPLYAVPVEGAMVDIIAEFYYGVSGRVV